MIVVVKKLYSVPAASEVVAIRTVVKVVVYVVV
jgi:hypothetical protein